MRRKVRIWSHLLNKSLMEIFVFCTVWNGKQTFCRINRGVFREFSNIYDGTSCENSYKRHLAFSYFSQTSSIIDNGNL